MQLNCAACNAGVLLVKCTRFLDSQIAKLEHLEHRIKLFELRTQLNVQPSVDTLKTILMTVPEGRRAHRQLLTTATGLLKFFHGEHLWKLYWLKMNSKRHLCMQYRVPLETLSRLTNMADCVSEPIS